MTIPRPAQFLQLPGQGYLSGYPGGVWSGTQDAPHTSDILGPNTYGGEGGGAL